MLKSENKYENFFFTVYLMEKMAKININGTHEEPLE